MERTISSLLRLTLLPQKISQKISWKDFKNEILFHMYINIYFKRHFRDLWKRTHILPLTEVDWGHKLLQCPYDLLPSSRYTLYPLSMVRKWMLHLDVTVNHFLLLCWSECPLIQSFSFCWAQQLQQWQRNICLYYSASTLDSNTVLLF